MRGRTGRVSRDTKSSLGCWSQSASPWNVKNGKWMGSKSLFSMKEGRRTQMNQKASEITSVFRIKSGWSQVFSCYPPQIAVKFPFLLKGDNDDIFSSATNTTMLFDISSSLRQICSLYSWSSHLPQFSSKRSKMPITEAGHQFVRGNFERFHKRCLSAS